MEQLHTSNLGNRFKLFFFLKKKQKIKRTQTREKLDLYITNSWKNAIFFQQSLIRNSL